MPKPPPKAPAKGATREGISHGKGKAAGSGTRHLRTARRGGRHSGQPLQDAGLRELRTARQARAAEAGAVAEPRHAVQGPHHQPGTSPPPSSASPAGRTRRSRATPPSSRRWPSGSSSPAGLLTLEEAASCPNEDCEQPRPVRGAITAERTTAGRAPPPNGRGARWRCKACRRRFTVSDPVRLGDRNQRLGGRRVQPHRQQVAVAPRRVRGSQALPRPSTYYPILRFIHRRCRAHSGAVDRALIDGRLQLPLRHEDRDRRAGVHHELDVAARPPQRGPVELLHRGRRQRLHSGGPRQLRRRRGPVQAVQARGRPMRATTKSPSRSAGTPATGSWATT